METIKKGSRGETVKTLQRALNLLADGIFGTLTEEAVKEFQLANGLTPDGIVGTKTWSKLNVLKASKRKIKEIICHCTATKEGVDMSVEAIRRYHIQDRGWSDIGYHYVIYRDGSIHTGRDVDVSGAHCKGHNTISIGVCYVGGLDSNKKPKDTRTDQQKAALIKLLKELKAMYPGVTIHGHYEFANKACPCFKPKEEYASL